MTRPSDIHPTYGVTVKKLFFSAVWNIDEMALLFQRGIPTFTECGAERKDAHA